LTITSLDYISGAAAEATVQTPQEQNSGGEFSSIDIFA
jgi:hypothetical protein